jgi:hypothetical protein
MKKLEFKPNSKDFNEILLAFKTHAYHKFYEILRAEHELKTIEPQEVNLKEEEDKKQTSKDYKAHIGDGNNSAIVKNVLKMRQWWSLQNKPSPNTCDFIWTQWIQSKIIKKLAKFSDENKEDYDQFIYNKLEANHHISNKKDLYLNLAAFYKYSDEKAIDNIPLTFLVYGGENDKSFKDFLMNVKQKEISDLQKSTTSET